MVAAAGRAASTAVVVRRGTATPVSLLSRCSSSSSSSSWDQQRRLRPASRRASSSSSSPSRSATAAQQIAARLHLPCFPAHSHQLHLIPSPTDFHSTLISLLQSAQRRIILSSLYIGPTESDLVHVHLRKALERNPQLRCTILLDALRSTREGLSKPSAASLVAALARDFPNQVDARLHLTPRATSSLVSKLLPSRFGEGLGLQHMKLYLADDSLIISGANLSRDYFTNRQDRYMLVRNHPELVDYAFDLVVDQFARHAYRIEPVTTSSSASQLGDDRLNAAYELVWDGGNQSERVWSSQRPRRSRVDESAPREYAWADSFAQHLRNMTSRWQHRTQPQLHDEAAEVSIVPLVQLGPVGLTQETDALRLLFSEYLQGRSDRSGQSGTTTIDLTTGYFSPSPALVDLLLSRHQNRFEASYLLRILTASPRSNGFFGSGFPSGLLPAAYVLLERAFAKRARAAGWVSSSDLGQVEKQHGRRLEMRRWERPGWTYHAKGIWITPPSSLHPTTTFLGSSNYGRRSAHLDAECTFLISTASARTPFAARLGAERDALLLDPAQARAWDWEGEGEDHRREADELGIKLGPLVQVLTWALKGLL
ncbi:hypothetical protein V8E36_000683 [Tilletia maclaganii]